MDVSYKEVEVPIRPKNNIDQIRPLLPAKYSPLQESGDGLQSVYLAQVPADLARLLLELLRQAGSDIHLELQPALKNGHREQIVAQIENAVESEIQSLHDIGPTEKEQIVMARRGQGRFKENVQGVEKGCRVSGVTDSQFLIASHIKPWRVATNQERLDGENGLLLSPNIDFLFDRGFVSFGDDGTLLISSVVDKFCLSRLGVPVDGSVNVGSFSPRQKEYLSYHRRNIFLETGRDS